MTYCVIGAGAAGLAVARHLKASSIPFEVIEREADVGGIWDASLPHSPVYHSAHLISSKPLTQFPDFPMPGDYPDYPHHGQALEYLRSYAKAFGLYEFIRFGRTVEGAERAEGNDWNVTFSDGESRVYSGLIVAAGIHRTPSLPEVRGEFDGACIHSSRYKTPEIFRNKRVLIVGAGNSGCDIAVEAGQHAARTFLSVRRGYYYIPKYALGRPIDQVGELGLKLRLPLFIRRSLDQLLLRIVVGSPEQFGLPRPDHKLLETHPIVNSQILQSLGQGDIRPKPDLLELKGREVLFKDGSTEQVDLIVYATGYRVSFPFLDARHLNSADGRPDFYLHAFHPTYENLFIVGLLVPDGGVWPLMDLQARAVARYVQADRANAAGLPKARALKQGPRPDLGGGIRYVASDRHRLEVEHSSYRRRLRSLIRLLDH
ncbi:MAG: flavin-containing monooxygenase [Gemmatimonadales bacterium]